MFPHERSLVKRLANKPFALLGVNTDDNKNFVKQQNKQQQINWRSWFDGSTQGPICTQYKVRGFPTIYVLDDKGVIRYKGVRGEAMDKAVDTLLKDVGKKAASRDDASKGSGAKVEE
jgi:hypothetical protein